MDTNGHEWGEGKTRVAEPSLVASSRVCELEWEEEAPLLHGKLVYAIVGCALEVMNQLGHGLNEKTYENSLVVEFGLQGIPCEQQRKYDVRYKGVKVSEFVPDLIIADSVIVDAKVIERIGDHERGQMLNFHRKKLEWQRLVL